MKTPRVLIVSPTLNEARNVRGHARRVLAALPSASLLIVDDDSPDETWRIAEDLAQSLPRLFVLRRREDHGFGRSYVAGFRWAIERGFDRVIMMDADGSHPAKTLPLLVEASSSSDFVVGSRYRPGGGVSNWSTSRRLLSRSANRYAAFWTRVPCSDLTGGFNCLHSELLKALPPLRSDGYAFQIELKFRAHRNGSIFGEVPILFSERARGESKLSRGHIFEGLRLPPALRFDWRSSR